MALSMASRGINTSFSGGLLDEVLRHADQGGMSPQDAVRELVRIGLSMTNPEDAVIAAARQRAYDDCRRWVMREFSVKMTEFSRDVERAAGVQIWSDKQAPRAETTKGTK